MAIFCTGDMWSRIKEVDLFCFTANATIKKDGALVMGRGMARQVRDRYPGIDYDIGEAITNSNTGYPVYGFHIVYNGEEYSAIGVFQVKRHYKQHAELALIEKACLGLFQFLLGTPESKVALNFPGIGYGGLSREEVWPIVSLLPENVEIWESY